MLQSLNIRDFVIVDSLELDFKSGFTALTGETGAGKSILIDGLSLALGARAETSVVRKGAAKAEIAVEFALDTLPSARAWLTESELVDEDKNLCLFRRVIDNTGRSRGFINGNVVTLTQMRELSAMLLDIHGQHEHQSLLSRSAQRTLLDNYAGNDALLENVRGAFSTWNELRKLREDRETNEASLTREREELQWQIGELEALAFTLNAWETTLGEQRRLANAASLIEAAESAIATLGESETDAQSQVDSVLSRLQQEVKSDPALGEIVELVQGASVQIKEAVHSLRQYLKRLDLDPASLAEADRRIAAVQEVARKFRIEPARIPDVLQQRRTRMELLGGSQSLDDLRAREKAAEEKYLEIARQLSKKRSAAAKKFSKAVTESLQTLAMPGGQFAVELPLLQEPGAEGLETCEFQVAAHEGQGLGSLSKVASGGELSRVSLAIQVLASAKAGVPTLIFDEVDAGIGGRVAEIVGRLLRELGMQHQVFAVTHLPQVAACASQQFQVSKSAMKGVAVSHIVELDAASRVEEIARMLGGLTITAATRKHAEEMLGSSQR